MIKARLVGSKAMRDKHAQAKKKQLFLRGYALVLGLFFSASCFSEEWYIKPSLSQTIEYDDNKLLIYESNIRKAKKQGKNINTTGYGIITSAEAKTGVRSDNYDVFFMGRLNLKRYISDLDYDTDDFFLNLNARYDLNTKNTFRFSAKYNQESTLTSELDVTGETQDNVPRTKWSISPEWQHNLSETKFIQMIYSHEEVFFEEDEIDVTGETGNLARNRRYFDYTYDQVSLSFNHQWNEQLLNFLTVGWSRYAVPANKSETDEYLFEAGLEYEITETWSASLMGGGRYTVTDRGAINGPKPPEIVGIFEGEQLIGLDLVDPDERPAFSDSQLGMVFSLGTKKRFETGYISANYSRSTSPTSNGRLQTVDRFSTNYLYKITQHLEFHLNGQINITKATADENSTRDNRDRTYYTVKPSLKWKFNRQLSLSGGYRYRRQERNVVDDTDNLDANNSLVLNPKTIEDSAESHAVFLTLKYQWDAFTKQDF